MASHTRQHWIPKAYLDAWCDPDPSRQNPRRVYRYHRNGVFKDYQSPSRIFTIDNLYTVPGPDGSRDLATEHALSRLEHTFSRILKTYLIRSIPLSPADRRSLVWFIAAMRNRSPAKHVQHQNVNNHVLRVANSMEESLKVMSHEQRADFHTKTRRNSFPHGDTDRGISLTEFRKIAARPFGAYLPRHVIIEAKLLEQMHLTVVSVPESQSLITSDRPVVWWDLKDPSPSRNPLGLSRPIIQISCPLTPHLCALISHEPGPEYADTNTRGADILNMRTLYRCAETFISCSADLVVDWT